MIHFLKEKGCVCLSADANISKSDQDNLVLFDMTTQNCQILVSL